MNSAISMENRIQLDILTYMAKVSVNAILGSVLVAALVVWIASGKIEPHIIYGWCGYLALVNAARGAWSINLLSQVSVDIPAQQRQINLLMLAHASTWVGMGYSLFPPDFAGQVCISMLALGVAAIAMQTVIFDRRLIVLMIFAAIGGVEYRLIETGQENQITLAIFLAIFSLVIIFTSFRLRAAFFELVKLKHEHQDVAESLNEVTNQLQATVENLQQEYLVKSAFIAELHHELRTPINAISGFTQLLELSPSITKDEDAVAKIKHIKKAVNHVHDLVDRVLDNASIEAGEIQLDLVDFDIGSSIEAAIDMLQVSAADRNVRVSFETSPNRYMAYADPLRLRQVLLNLISNAIKYNRIGGDVKVTVEQREESELQISVTDTGIGLKSIDRETVFRAFGRVRANQTVAGTGLGLYLSNKVVEQMGGALKFHSEPGRGSRFYFTLPVAQIDTGQQAGTNLNKVVASADSVIHADAESNPELKSK